MEVKKITSEKFDSALKAVKLVNNTLLVKAFAEPDELTTAHGLILKRNPAENRLIVGEVIAVGPGITDFNGKRVDMNIKEGDKVVLDKYNNSKLDMTSLLHMLGVDVKDENGKPITYYHVVETSIIMAFDKDIDIPEEFYFSQFLNKKEKIDNVDVAVTSKV